ncbi:MAG: hypothetical protein V4732_03500 [Pseudomonadota bacterium]
MKPVTAGADYMLMVGLAISKYRWSKSQVGMGSPFGVIAMLASML